ncbi:MAG TPA: LL-diaminopimelate aminotransferase [Kofleriaceae bacterium]|nr:LL-diaminopimelate aminotransferase [Kofleriaceae bacterium]
MTIEFAQRILDLPPYLFAHIDALKNEAIASGADVIDLGVGTPDLPTPAPIIEALAEAARDPATHQYPPYNGTAAFREAAAAYYQRRFGVTLDPATEVLALIGSKEGIGHLPIAFVDPGDLVLVPNPGYPVYADTTRFCGGEVEYVPLTRDNGFLPDLDAIPAASARRAKMMWLCYPNNPTGAVAPLAFYERAVAWAKANDVVLLSDAAYADMYFDEDNPPPSILEVDGAKDCAIEFYSLSKTFNMTGWRIAFAAGNAKLVAGVGKAKTHFDSGCFEAVQRAGIAALALDSGVVRDLRAVYRQRREVLCGGLAAAGLDVVTPAATFYCMVANPAGQTSMEFAALLLAEAHIVATPCNGFGDAGEGFVRMTLCAPAERLAEAAARVAKLAM